MTPSPVSLRSAPVRFSAHSGPAPRPAGRAAEAELLRLARYVAAGEGWVVDASTAQVRGDPPQELRVAVSGGRLPARCLLRVRERQAGAEPSPAELDARSAAMSEHVVHVVGEPIVRRLRGREVDAVVLDYPEFGDVESLVARRRGVRSGEAATILLGVAAGVAALHAAGWGGPDLTGRGVVFLGDGCPALAVLDQVKPMSAETAVADAEAFYAFARTICLRVVDGKGMRLLGAVEAGLRRGSWSALTESVLTAVAPEPVALPDQRESVGGGTQPGTDGPADPDGRNGPSRPGAVAAGVAAGGASVAGSLLGRLRRLVDRGMELLDGRPGRALGARLRTMLRRRPALVAAAAVPVVAALVVTALLPAQASESGRAGTGAGRETSRVETGGAVTDSVVEEAPANDSAAGGTRPVVPSTADSSGAPASSHNPTAPAAALAGGGAQSGSGEERASGLASEDPVDAARAVLDARHACFAARPTRPACLSEVLDAGTPILTEETSELDTAGAAGERDFRGAQLSLVERWGGAALVGVVPDSARTPKSEPASLLLVRGEAGWRLRAVYP